VGWIVLWTASSWSRNARCGSFLVVVATSGVFPVSSQELFLLELGILDVYACLIEVSHKIVQLLLDQCLLVDQTLSASLMSVGIFQVLVSSLVDGVGPVMLDKMVQSRVVCQSVCLDFNCIEIMWCVAVLTLLIPVMDACVWVLDNLKRCTHLSAIKCD
jgi:hypothetical protein